MEKTKILVVDDEEEICKITKSFLIKKDYSVFTALNAQEAIKLIKEERPHIVLLDIRLGNESGMDVLHQARQIDKDLKIIMVTALEDEEIIRQARALGADDYVTKPFTTSYLNDFILQKIYALRLRQVRDKKL